MKIVLIFLTITLLQSCSLNSVNKVENGYIDIKDFSGNKTIKLDGSWLFTDSLVDSNFTDWNKIKVPSIWKNKILNGTYFLKIDLPEYEEEYSIFIPDCFTAYEIEINDNRYSNGSIDPYEPSIRKRFFTFLGSGETSILIKVSDFNTTVGGIRSSIILGTSIKIQTEYFIQILLDSLIIGSLIIQAIFYFSYWIVVRSKRELIYLALAVCRTLPLSKKKNFQNSISRIKFLHECKFYKY